MNEMGHVDYSVFKMNTNLEKITLLQQKKNWKKNTELSIDNVIFPDFLNLYLNFKGLLFRRCDVWLKMIVFILRMETFYFMKTVNVVLVFVQSFNFF